MNRDPKVEIYPDVDGEWRWHVIASNGKIISVSSESYVRREDCVRGLRLTLEAAEAHFRPQSKLANALYGIGAPSTIAAPRGIGAPAAPGKPGSRLAAALGTIVAENRLLRK